MPSNIPTLISGLGDMYMQPQSITQLQQIGPSTVDPLLKALDTDDQVTQAGIIEVLQSFSSSVVPQLTVALGSPSQVVQAAAINLLAAIGSPVVPQLIAILTSNNMLASSNAAVTIKRIGPTALPVLKEAAKNDESDIQTKLLLIELDLDQFSIYESDLVDALGSSNQAVAAQAINAVVSQGESALPLLSDLMCDSDPYKQQNSTNSMIRLSPVSIPVLVDCLSGSHSQVTQQNAVRALAAIGGPAEKQLREAATNDDQYVSQNARTAIQAAISAARKQKLYR
ncbi:MAG: HEAT repeat domain-containing protein [Phycisphaerales bacterium]|nr:HEAT repeat domain-containing protein [Phycisphaerales bacterium]